MNVLSLIERAFGGDRAHYALGEISNALTLALFVVIARPLSVSAYGDFIGIFAASSIIGTVAGFGLFSLVTREVAKEPGNAWPLLSEALRAQAGATLLGLVLLAAYVQLTELSGRTAYAAWLIGGSFLIRGFSQTVRGMCRGVERFDLESAFLWVERSLLLLLAGLAANVGYGLLGVAASFFLVRTLTLPAFLWVARQKTSIPSNQANVSIGIGAASPFAAFDLMWNLYYQVDAALLKVLSTSRQTGLYGAIYRFYDALATIPRLVVAVGYPKLAKLWVESREEFRQLLEEYSRLLLIFGLPAVYFTVYLSRPALSFLFGEAYLAAAPALAAVAIGSFVAGYGFLYQQALQCSEMERVLAKIVGIAVATNLGLNLALIPPYGFLGATAATLTTEIIYVASLGWVLSRNVFSDKRLKDWFLIVPAIVGLSVAALHLLGSAWHYLSIIIVGGTWVMTLLWQVRKGGMATINVI